MTLLQTPSFTLHGKRALVTGGSRGIGFAAAVALAQAGAEVWIAARGREALAHATGLAAEHSLAFHPLELDITDTQEVARVLATLPTPDILVNSAGLARHQPFLEVNEDNFDAVMALNLRATFLSASMWRAECGRAVRGDRLFTSHRKWDTLVAPSVACTVPPNSRLKG